MSEQTDKYNTTLEIMLTRPWLFKKNPNITLVEYIQHFENINDMDFFMFPAMFPFQPGILDQYKDKVYNTMFLPVSMNNVALHTIVQISKQHHIFFLWNTSNDGTDVVIYATICTTSPTDYNKFLSEQRKFVYDDEKSIGFDASSIFRQPIKPKD